ncbi:MAG: dihydrofolate reductase [Luminiphilus sp.]|nr:dihydrofolate reductase [Luminiphilus sp.]MDG1506410.1 dihydrofolate reductase [Luminiphilus sp.]MDG1799335.1 dihydrofolate reductase [Luminiphilus sp.]
MRESDSLPVSIVVAVADNGVIGRGNALPWDLPDDLQHFKRTTMGRPIVMGRKTFESIGRPLPGRLNIILTRDPSWTALGVSVASSIEQAIDLAEGQAFIDGADSVMVIGGAEVYRQALPFASRAFVTRVHGHVDGDAFFDLEELAAWREVTRERIPAGEHNSHDFSVIRLEKA